MRTSSRSVFHHWSRDASVTDRIAVYVRTVVWRGRRMTAAPMPINHLYTT